MKQKKIKTGIAIVLLIACVGGFAAWQYWKIREKDKYHFNPQSSVKTSTDAEHGYSVSTPSDLATEVGMSVLEAGGNAADAAIAVGYTLAVVEPYASGLGGSGGLLIYDSNSGDCTFYDYRATAGSASNASDNIGVPGFVAGLDSLHKDYGSLSLSDVLDPAIYYAENGFTINENLGYRLNYNKDELSKYSWFYDENKNYLETGGLLRQPQLAKVIQAIASDGSDAFYKGWIAEDIVEATSLTMEDLADYQVYKREAIQGTFQGYTVYSANSPLSGVTLVQMLEMADMLDIANPESDPKTYLSQVKQITAAAYGDRYSTIGDPSFYKIDTQNLVSETYVKNLLNQDCEDEGYDKDTESIETTSYSIVDSNGLVVTATNTLTRLWGSRIAVDGVFLNNSNTNFSPSGINAYESGKRSRTYTAPTIITGDNGYLLGIGTPGGNIIPSRLFNVLVDILKFGEDPQEAVSKMGLLYKNGVLTLEVDENNKTWFNTTNVTDQIVWKPTGMWWGTIALAGYSDSDGAFSAYDSRRGATFAGVYNPK